MVMMVILPRRDLAIAHFGFVDPCEFPTCGNLDCRICDSGDCVRALPKLTGQKKIYYIDNIIYPIGLNSKVLSI